MKQDKKNVTQISIQSQPAFWSDTTFWLEIN